MTHSTRTFALTPKWDLHLDSAGHLAIAKEADASAQNVANECRLFTADAYFAQNEGIPHFILELGRIPAAAALKTHLRRAARKIPDVAEIIDVEISSLNQETRTLNGEIRFTTQGGQNVATNL